jgi:hypothetical protein
MAASSLGRPDEAGDLTSFPRVVLERRTTLYRVHRRDRRPWWFASVDDDPASGGRFDLTHPAGTCYTALSAVCALLEVVARRPIRTIPEQELHRRWLANAATPRPLAAADTTAASTRGFGITGELHAGLDYASTRAWAAALHAAGYRALLSIPRHDPRQGLRTLPLFDTAGEHAPFGWQWQLDSTPIPPDVVDQLQAWGIDVLPIPTSVPVQHPRFDDSPS